MKRARKPKARDDLRHEYSLDYGKARSNRFAARMAARRVAVVLDPDVASVFKSARAVNTLLRSVISVLPAGIKTKRADRRRAEIGRAHV